jgi:hypothetical protein
VAVGNPTAGDIASPFLSSAAAAVFLPVTDRTSRGTRFLTRLPAAVSLPVANPCYQTPKAGGSAGGARIRVCPMFFFHILIPLTFHCTVL